MTTLRQAAQQALEALVRASSYCDIYDAFCRLEEIITRLRQALEAEQQVKPYAYAVYFPDQPTEELVHDLDDLCDDLTNRENSVVKLYAHQQPAQQPLTLEQIEAIDDEVMKSPRGYCVKFARAIERAHGIIGTEGGAV